MSSGPDIPGWKRVLAQYPRAARRDLDQARIQGGMLRPAQVGRIVAAMGRDLDALLPDLLPLAACHAVTPISRFRVGVIVAGAGARPALYFGANLEVAGGALGYSVHAEQAAVNNAWLHGERRLTRLAVTAAPCGHCRQFLNELDGAESLRFLLPGGQPEWTIGQLLPSAFGPADLKVRERLLRSAPPRRLKLRTRDRLVRAARAAAGQSYAPYSGGAAGCALELIDGTVVVGRTAENAAYNPTLPAISSALSAAVFRAGPAALRRIARAVLVEAPAAASQASLTEAVLLTASPDAAMEYVVAAPG